MVTRMSTNKAIGIDQNNSPWCIATDLESSGRKGHCTAWLAMQPWGAVWWHRKAFPRVSFQGQCHSWGMNRSVAALRQSHLSPLGRCLRSSSLMQPLSQVASFTDLLVLFPSSKVGPIASPDAPTSACVWCFWDESASGRWRFCSHCLGESFSCTSFSSCPPHFPSVIWIFNMAKPLLGNTTVREKSG